MRMTLIRRDLLAAMKAIADGSRLPLNALITLSVTDDLLCAMYGDEWKGTSGGHAEVVAAMAMVAAKEFEADARFLARRWPYCSNVWLGRIVIRNSNR